MNRKTTLDIAILISCLTGMILSYVYLDNYIEKEISLFILGITGILFLLLSVRDKSKADRPDRHGTGRKGISEILLLGEEGNVTAVWDIYGKTSIVFGKDERENQVDVNLKNTLMTGREQSSPSGIQGTGMMRSAEHTLHRRGSIRWEMGGLVQVER